MGALGIIGSIVLFPFKLIFGGGKKKETVEQYASTNTQPLPETPMQPDYPSDVSAENLKVKVDLMLAQIDNMKIEYDAINQRIQNIERMVRELYAMAKS